MRQGDRWLVQPLIIVAAMILAACVRSPGGATTPELPASIGVVTKGASIPLPPTWTATALAALAGTRRPSPTPLSSRTPTRLPTSSPSPSATVTITPQPGYRIWDEVSGPYFVVQYATGTWREGYLQDAYLAHRDIAGCEIRDYRASGSDICMRARCQFGWAELGVIRYQTIEMSGSRLYLYSERIHLAYEVRWQAQREACLQDAEHVLASVVVLPGRGCVDRASLVEDVTIPDGTTVLPGASFTKTWRLRNTGTCTWTEEYRIVTLIQALTRRSRGAGVPLTGEVLPGEEVNVSVQARAPRQAGEHRVKYMLVNEIGFPFGLGEHGDKPFWLLIRVPTPAGPEQGMGGPE